MKKLIYKLFGFNLQSMNLNLDPTERHWITMILFKRVLVQINQHRIPLTNGIFEKKVWTDSNTTYFIMGRIMVVVLTGKTFQPEFLKGVA